MTSHGATTMLAAGMPIPDRLVYAIKFLRGEDAGTAWLEGLDDVLGAYRDAWNLTFEGIAQGGAMSCCAYCRDGSLVELVLKVPVEPRSGVIEARTLQHWSTCDVAPQVVESDSTTGVFLMERMRPGTTFTGVSRLDDVAPFVEMFVLLEGAGRAPGWRGVPPLSALIGERLGWAQQRFAAPDVASLRPDLEQAAELAASLDDDKLSRVVHGDLQAKNLLWGSGNRLCCIDPLTAVGDPVSDVAMWAVLQDSEVPIGALLQRLARELSVDLERLQDWAFIISTAELRPLQLGRFERQKRYLEDYASVR